jgi:hypothetical protein
MPASPLRPLAAVALAAALAACAADTATAPSRAPAAAPAAARDAAAAAVTRDLAAVRAATARYHRVEAAVADGFADTRHCVEAPDGAPAAAMGVHFLHGARVGADPDPTAPAVLVYEPQADGSRALVAVEYMVARGAWDAAHPGARPALFGHAFEDGPMDTYTLHVWVWRHNPAGMFAPFNPKVSCAAAPGGASGAGAHAAHAAR